MMFLKMSLRKLSRHTLPIPTFYITNMALLLGLSSVLGNIHSTSRSIAHTRYCPAEMPLFNKTVTNQDVWLTYTGNESDYAPYSLKYDDLQPDSILDAPLAPRECDITVTTINGKKEQRYAVVNISWSTPSNVTGLKGYVAEAKFMYDGWRHTMHRAFVPNLNTSRYDPNKADYYDCLRIGSDRDDAVVRFSSLPHSYNNFVEAYVHYIDTDMSNSDPWSTLMVVICHPQESMARVRFTAAPQKLGFTQYKICHNFSRIFSTTIEAKPYKKQPEKAFYNIKPGVYEVRLLAQRDNEEILTCDTAPKFAAVVTKINMSRSVGIYKATSNNIYVKQSEDNDGRIWITEQFTWSNMVTVAVVAGLVALVLTTMLAVVRRKLFCVKIPSSSTSSSVMSDTSNESESVSEEKIVKVTSGLNLNTSNESESVSEEKIVKVTSGLNLDSSTDGTTVTEKRKLFILYSSDNKSHRRVVHRFALFLERHCLCDVVLDTWCEQDLAELSPIHWLHRQLHFVDTILVIHSEGGTRRFKASLEGHGYEKNAEDSGHLEDIFVPAVKQLINDQQGGTQPKTRRVFNAYFTYSKKTAVINAMRGQTYELMRNIEELFFLIHGLSKSGKSGVSRVPVINYNQFSSVPEGKSLLKAIDAAKRYHTNFPGWFDSISIKSDCNTLQCSREKALADAVSSTTDLCNDSVTDIRQTDLKQPHLEHEIDRTNGIYYTKIDDVYDSGLASSFDNPEVICHQEGTIMPNNEKKQFNQAVSPDFRQFRASPRHTKSISMMCESYIHDEDNDDYDDDERGCPNFIKPDSIHDDTSSIDSLTYDNTARKFNEVVESS